MESEWAYKGSHLERGSRITSASWCNPADPVVQIQIIFMACNPEMSGCN